MPRIHVTLESFEGFEIAQQEQRGRGRYILRFDHQVSQSFRHNRNVPAESGQLALGVLEGYVGVEILDPRE